MISNVSNCAIENSFVKNILPKIGLFTISVLNHCISAVFAIVWFAFVQKLVLSRDPLYLESINLVRISQIVKQKKKAARRRTMDRKAILRPYDRQST